MATNVAGSVEPTPYRLASRSRVSTQPPAAPRARPALDQPCSLADDETEDVARTCAERHAQTDLSSALSDRIRDHAVEAERRQHEAHRRKYGHQYRAEAFTDQHVRQLLPQRHHVRDRLGVVHRPHRRSDGSGHVSPVAIRAGHQIQRHRRRRKRLLRVWHVPRQAARCGS